MEKEQYSEHNQHSESGNTKEKLKLAISATLHCLLGCGIGEVLGVVI